MNRILQLFVFVSLISASCTTVRYAGADDGRIEVNFVQVNDVYEIAPVSGGTEGGMARVATVKKNYQAQNPNTYMIMAGDFLSPSVYNSLQFEGKPIRGRQMVDVMNAAGMDFAIFGNHEFDIRENELQERLDESKFQWISSNAFHKTTTGVVPFTQSGKALPEYRILNVKDADGTTARIGVFGIVLPFNRADFVQYTDALAVAKNMYNRLKDSADAVIAFTHQGIRDDEKLAAELPGLAAILGGHEHDQRFVKVGNVYITKALSNAKSAYVVNIKIDKRKNKVSTTPTLVKIDQSIPFDSSTNVVVQKWVAVADNSFGLSGFDAQQVVLPTGEPLNGIDSVTRKESTNLTRIVTAAMQYAAPKADIVLLNGGSIRVDDMLVPPITQYDILRTLPFGGGIKEADLKGSLIIKTLDAGLRNIRSGGYLHYNAEVTRSATGQWLLKGQPIDPNKAYRVAITDFLFTGKESNLDFLNPQNPDVVKVYDTEKTSAAMADIRMAIVQYLKNKTIQ